MKAWHFLETSRQLRWPDKRDVKPGCWYRAKGKIELCKNGMHGSKKLSDALSYAPGPIVCRVRIKGEIISARDKIVGRDRIVLGMADATSALTHFTCVCAANALAAEAKTGRLPRLELWDAIDARRKYQLGKIDEAQLREHCNRAEFIANQPQHPSAVRAARIVVTLAGFSVTLGAAVIISQGGFDLEYRTLTKSIKQLIKQT